MDRVQAEQIATAQLDASEHLLWSGSPDPKRSALQALPIALVGIPMSGFVVFWMSMAYSIQAKTPHVPGPWALFPFFGAPFLLIGLGVIAAPIWAALGARRTAYAVTDRRALIIASGGSRAVQSFTHDDIGNVQMVERADGSGDVYFANRSFVSQRGAINQTRIGFIGIPDVRTVEQMVRSRLRQEAA